mmetsp:Transcript_39157/g.94056  ORF Transcript_39157/g.94056 Transcript_39157/m.94056 type:complete len:216 (+) Transcript_39157:161-808(+)
MVFVAYPTGFAKDVEHDTISPTAKGFQDTPRSSARRSTMGSITAAAALLVIASVTIVATRPLRKYAAMGGALKLTICDAMASANPLVSTAWANPSEVETMSSTPPSKADNDLLASIKRPANNVTTMRNIALTKDTIPISDREMTEKKKAIMQISRRDVTQSTRWPTVVVTMKSPSFWESAPGDTTIKAVSPACQRWDSNRKTFSPARRTARTLHP